MKTFLKFLFIIIIAAALAGVIFYFTSDKGTTNADATASSDTAASSVASEGIIINEVMSNNKGIYPDDTGNNSDWVEFYNTTDKDIDMTNYALSDDIKKPEKWPFPNIMIKSHGYLVIFLTGDTKSDVQNGIIHCSFKLNSTGETILLSNPSGQKTDSVDIPSLAGNISFGLVNGVWLQTGSPTPGFENSDAGFSAFRESMTVKDPPVLITEIMNKNRMTLKDAQGEYPDWVEVANVSSQDVNLSGFGLSDKANDPLKWRFPDVSLKAGEYITVFCSGVLPSDTTIKQLYADFQLSSLNATVTLSDSRGRLMDSVQIENISTDWSYERVFQNGVPSDTWQQASQPTPGYPNTDAGFAEFEKNNGIATGDILISEVLTSNNKIDIEGDKKSYDYIEVENRGQSAVNLSGYGLTNDAANPAKFLFPDVTLQPGKDILVLASGLNATQSNGMKDLNAPFKLSRLGDNVSLFNAQGQLLDRYFIGTLPQNVSIGREEGKAGLLYFTAPTPGQKNSNGMIGFAQEVQYSQQSGKYDGSVQLSLTSTEGCDIYYTLDGNTPSQDSTKYAGPISVDKTTVIRAKAFKADYIPSGTSTSTYFVNTAHTLPLISIVTDPALLFDPTTGIYEEGPNASQVAGQFKVGANYYSDTEVPASFEVYDKDGVRVFDQDIALRMSGGLSLALKQQKTFAIYARSNYGANTMTYPFFENRPFTDYKSLILRSGGRDDTKIKEAVALGLVDGKMNITTQAIKPYVLYVNGKYWGVYYMMEKRNKYMFAAHEGASDPDSMNILKGSGGIIKLGTNEGYNEILKLIRSKNLTLSKDDYDYVAARLDTDSFMDLMINEMYIGNNDPGNLQFFQILPDGKWKQAYYDFCITFQSFDSVKLRLNSLTSGSDMLNALMSYQPWRQKFIERFAWALKELYSPGRVNSMIDGAANAISGEIEAQNRAFSDTPTAQEWNSMVQGMRTFANNQGKKIVQYLKADLTLTDAQKQLLDDAVK